MTDGHCDPAFAAVREVFDANLARGDDLGAAVAVVVGGRVVVDLWGGVADERTGRAWQQDTAAVTFSCTKAVTATAALLIAQRGQVRLDAPVARWWPEFAARGKQSVTGEHLLSHQAGLPAFERDIAAEEAGDPAAMAAELAGQAPEWEPGTAHGYHALSFGWLVGELVRRHAGPVADFVRVELGDELRLGVSEAELPALARLVAGRPLKAPNRPAPAEAVARLVAATQQPGSPLLRSTANPPASFNRAAVLTAGWPAAGLITTARGLARFYARLVAGRWLARSVLADAVCERVRGPDRTLVTDTAFGLGFMRASANMWLPPAARATAFGHPGASGALGLGDLDRDLAFAFVPNVIRPALGDRRAYRLVEAVYAALS